MGLAPELWAMAGIGALVLVCLLWAIVVTRGDDDGQA